MCCLITVNNKPRIIKAFIFGNSVPTYFDFSHHTPVEKVSCSVCTKSLVVDVHEKKNLGQHLAQNAQKSMCVEENKTYKKLE